MPKSRVRRRVNFPVVLDVPFGVPETLDCVQALWPFAVGSEIAQHRVRIAVTGIERVVGVAAETKSAAVISTEIKLDVGPLYGESSFQAMRADNFTYRLRHGINRVAVAIGNAQRNAGGDRICGLASEIHVRDVVHADIRIGIPLGRVSHQLSLELARILEVIIAKYFTGSEDPLIDQGRRKCFCHLKKIAAAVAVLECRREQIIHVPGRKLAPGDEIIIAVMSVAVVDAQSSMSDWRRRAGYRCVVAYLRCKRSADSNGIGCVDRGR